MSTQHKGTNAVISAFVPFFRSNRLFNFYTVPQPHVFMHFHQKKFCIFIQKFTLQSIVLNWSFLLYLKSTSCA